MFSLSTAGGGSISASGFGPGGPNPLGHREPWWTKSNALRKVAKEKERALEKTEEELREPAKKSASL